MIAANDLKNIEHAAKLLKQEELVAIPTETVYGLAGNAFSEKAITSIYSIKNRPAVNPLIVHIKNKESITEIAKNIPPEAYLLAEKFWPGPLTLILEKQDHISSLITAGKNTVGVRVPNHELTLELLKLLDFPLVAPSANRSNHISPTMPEHVQNSLAEKAPYILDGGTCTSGIESTIIGFENEEIILYRHGSVAKEEIESVLNRKVKSIINDADSPKSPGMFKKHYSPVTPLVLCRNLAADLAANSKKKVGVICFQNYLPTYDKTHQRVLSAAGKLEEAAAKVYSTLYELDAKGYDLILVEAAPNHGIGVAINDRLTRASF